MHQSIFPSSRKPHHLHMDGHAISKGTVSAGGRGEMTCPLSPEVPGQGLISGAGALALPTTTASFLLEESPPNHVGSELLCPV